MVAADIEGRLRIDVEDDGIGLDAESAAMAEGGYGLAHVRERVRMAHGDAASVSIDARPEGGVRVRIEMPR